MAQAIRVEIRGLAELQAALPRFAKQVDEQAELSGRWAADRAAQQARASMPRRTGLLAASTAASGHTVAMGAPYATYVEYGGRGHPHSSTGNVLGPAAEDTASAYHARAESDAAGVTRRFPWPRQ